MKCFLINLMILCQISVSLIAQELPRGFAPGELEKMDSYLAQVIKSDRSEITLPELPRSMAEWEELDGLMIAWTDFYRVIQSEIVRFAQPQCEVLICCRDSAVVKSYLEGQGIDVSYNIRYLISNYNSIWIRDYGPNSAYTLENDSLIWVDWIYNRARFRDDSLARTVSKELDIPLYETNHSPLDLVHTGGNYMSDGLGLAFSSDLVLDENGPDNNFGFSNHSEHTVDSIMNLYLGTKTYAKMNKLPYDGIHHIDMHMKLLDEQTLLVGRYENDVADGEQINTNIDYILSNYTNSFGKPFNVHYMPMPPDADGRYPDQSGDYRTYTNAVFVNKTLVVPFYEEKYDTIARKIYEELLPGYNIEGIDCNLIIPSLGAIHCITKEVGSKDHLRLSVDIARPVTEESDILARQVNAIATHPSGVNEVLLYFKSPNATTFDSLIMHLLDPETSQFQAGLPMDIDTIHYYFKAKANNGKEISRPMTAPEGFFATRHLVASSNHSFIDQNNLSVFPNPASGITCIEIPAMASEKFEIRLFNCLGSEIDLLHSGKFDPNGHKVFFDASTLASGAYFIQLHSPFYSSTGKLIVR